MAKMKAANDKYKQLLKMAKERIQTQEEEMTTLKAVNKKLKEQVERESERADTLSIDDGDQAMLGHHTPGDVTPIIETSLTISRVCHRIRLTEEGGGDDEDEEIWALIEFDTYNPDGPELAPTSRKYKKWRKFETEEDLDDFIRRDTGEPLTLPPYSLSPEQSLEIQKEAKQQVSQVTEEFRRFRVRAEVQRKQADAQIRDLHNTNVQSATRRIEGEDVEKELEQARTDHVQLERLKAELAEQEAQWKEAYDVLLAENNTLKSSGSEALLAAQWRQRYETLLTEKDDLQTRLQMEVEKAEATAEQRRKVDAGKYEMKYRDLKESFRLYRKKAKEIFEAQQRGDVGLLQFADKSAEDAKLSYLKNLLVNYLSSDLAVKEHMEGAIGTVLKFTPDDYEKIKKRKEEEESWF